MGLWRNESCFTQRRTPVFDQCAPLLRGLGGSARGGGGAPRNGGEARGRDRVRFLGSPTGACRMGRGSLLRGLEGSARGGGGAPRNGSTIA